MKTKTIAFSLLLAFSGSALFAQTDTIPKKDTIPTPTDTIPKDTVSFNSILKQDLTVFNFSDAVRTNMPLLASKNSVVIWKEELENSEA
jgi:hypothetical protein